MGICLGVLKPVFQLCGGWGACPQSHGFVGMNSWFCPVERPSVKEILPLSTTAWEHVTEVHLSRYPEMGRTVDSLKHKFKELHNKKIPTGDPECPPAVARAKRLRHQIIDKMDGTDLNDEDDDDSKWQRR